MRLLHQRQTRRLTALAATALLTTALLTACGSSTPKAARHASTTAAPSSTSPGVSPPSAPPSTTTLTEHDNGRTVALHVRDHLRVVLASTYWTFQPSSNPTVLQPDGQPIVAPQIRGCVPGQGCGTVTADFTANSTGTAIVTATRTTCGEAKACGPANGHYQVTITVT